MMASAAGRVSAERVANMAMCITEVIETWPGWVGQSRDLDDITET